MKIHCTNIGKTVELPSIGLTLAEIASILDVKTKYSVLGALVNNKHEGLTYRVYNPREITFFDITHPEGQRTYARSLILMLYTAVRKLYPQAELNVMRSVSNGIYCELIGDNAPKLTAEIVKSIFDELQAITKADLPIEREEIETSEALKLLASQPTVHDLIKQHGDIYTTVHRLGKDNVMSLHGALVPRTGIIDVYNLTLYESGMLLSLPMVGNPEKTAPIVDQSKMFGTFQDFRKWQDMLGLRYLIHLNEGIEKGSGASLIQIVEASQEKRISAIADMILERKDKVKIILIAGPSSSGKTTFGKRLALQLIVNGIRPVNLSIDNYFVNREDTPRDENGDYDFEAVEAIDVPLFNEQLLSLVKGDEVTIPKFNFVTGSRYYDGEKLQMKANDVLIIEGTHGLTPQLTHLVPSDVKFKVYVCPLVNISIDAFSYMHTSDNRLIRRIVRDYKFRNYSATETISRWASVRRGEDKYIYPNQEEADAMYNTALLYEMSVLRAQAEPILLNVPRNRPEYAEARRLLNILSYFKPLSADAIPPTSLLREFLGGSSFKYD